MAMVREAGTLAKDGGELARVSCEVGGPYWEKWRAEGIRLRSEGNLQKIQWVNGKIHGIFFCVCGKNIDFTKLLDFQIPWC